MSGCGSYGDIYQGVSDPAAGGEKVTSMNPKAACTASAVRACHVIRSQQHDPLTQLIVGCYHT